MRTPTPPALYETPLIRLRKSRTWTGALSLLGE